MPDTLYEHVGKRIRLYRKIKRISVTELAARINKSKATVSKYEAGKIAIDVGSLFDIAWALGATPMQLTDYPEQRFAVPAAQNKLFDGADLLYLYHMYGKKIYSSAIRLFHTAGAAHIDATLFYKIADANDYENCEGLYQGIMHCYDTVASFTFQNCLNPVENILLNFCIPMNRASYIVGMISGLGVSSLAPSAYKAALSPDWLKKDEELSEILTITKEEFKVMKAKNMLIVERRG